MYEKRIELIERIKINLINYSTGQSVYPGFNYQEERKCLLSENLYRDKIPMFLKTCRNLDEFWGYIKLEYSTYQERREYIRNEFNNILAYLEEMQFHGNSVSNNIELPLHSGNELFYINETWNKAIERVSHDPEGAITIARTLLEEIFKYILVDAEESFTIDADLPKLYKSVRNLLNLSPEQHTEEIFKQVLGGCNSVIVGLGSLRSKHGDAHGKTPTSLKPGKRHAKLAVNLAGSMGEFIMDTYLEQGIKISEEI